MPYIVSGQLPAVAAAIVTGSNVNSVSPTTVSIRLANTSASLTEVITVTYTHHGVTTRLYYNSGLLPNATVTIANIPINPDDTINGVTSDATTVDFTITEGGSGGGPVCTTYAADGSVQQTNNNAVPAGNLALTGTFTGTSASASALAVGRLGATTPAFVVDASAGTSVTGFKVTAGASGGGLALALVGGGTNEALTLDAKGSGTITIGGTSTGAVVLPTTNITDAKNIVLATTTGTSFGSATTQKLSLYGVTPIVQPVNSVDVFTGLVNLGLRASGGTAAMTLPGALGMVDANITATTVTGTSFGGATTQKISFYGVTPITQPAASSAVSVTGTTGASTGVSLDTTFTGGGTAAFSIGGIVTRLKALGLLAA